MNMKKLLILLIVLGSCCLSDAAGYMHHIFSCDGGTYHYSFMVSESGISLVVSVESENLTFPPTPTLMLKTFDGQVIRLDGVNCNTTSSQGAVFISNMAFPITDLKATAIFPITEEQISLFANGISKVRINVLPCVHEREFKRDVIGVALYDEYQREKDTYDNF